MANLQDYYRLLEIAPEADDLAVRHALGSHTAWWSKQLALATSVEARAEAKRQLELLGEAGDVLLDGARRNAYDRQRTMAGGPAIEPAASRSCPFCSEPIQPDARKCRWCGEWLDGGTQPPGAPAHHQVDPRPIEPAKAGSSLGKVVLVGGLGLLALAGSCLWVQSHLQGPSVTPQTLPTIKPSQAALEAASSAASTSPAASASLLPSASPSPSGSPAAAVVTGLDATILRQAPASARACQPGDRVVVNYTGWLENGIRFDASVERGAPLEFVVGAGQALKGIESGVAGMKVGEIRIVALPSDLAFGAQGAPELQVPPNAKVYYQLELVAIR